VSKAAIKSLKNSLKNRDDVELNADAMPSGAKTPTGTGAHAARGAAPGAAPRAAPTARTNVSPAGRRSPARVTAVSSPADGDVLERSDLSLDVSAEMSLSRNPGASAANQVHKHYLRIPAINSLSNSLLLILR